MLWHFYDIMSAFKLCLLHIACFLAYNPHPLADNFSNLSLLTVSKLASLHSCKAPRKTIFAQRNSCSCWLRLHGSSWFFASFFVAKRHKIWWWFRTILMLNVLFFNKPPFTFRSAAAMMMIMLYVVFPFASVGFCVVPRLEPGFFYSNHSTHRSRNRIPAAFSMGAKLPEACVLRCMLKNPEWLKFSESFTTASLLTISCFSVGKPQ